MDLFGNMNKLERRIIDLSYKYKKAHISSCLGTVNLLDAIYKQKKPKDIVILGNAHAGLAQWVVLEKYGFCNAEKMLKKYGTHTFRDVKHGVYVSGGSLGQAETIAVGMALADRNRIVYLVTSDGACAEGSVWESLRIAVELKLDNLCVAVIINGYSAYGKVNRLWLRDRLRPFCHVRSFIPKYSKWPKWLKGLNGHYQVMNEDQYNELR